MDKSANFTQFPSYIDFISVPVVRGNTKIEGKPRLPILLLVINSIAWLSVFPII